MAFLFRVCGAVCTVGAVQLFHHGAAVCHDSAEREGRFGGPSVFLFFLSLCVSAAAGPADWDLFLSFDPDFWTGFFLLVIVCAVTALLLKKPLGRNLGGAAGYLAAAGAVSAAGVLANMALQWLLAVDSELETNRYNGTAGIFFFLIFIALLLYHYQLIIAAAVTAALLMCAMQGIVLAGGSFGVFLEKAPGGQFWIASMVVILASAAVGALTYALRKK